MDVVLDVGNTLTKVAVFKEDSMVDIRRFERSDSNGLRCFVSDIGSNATNKGELNSAIISNVAGDMEDLANALHQHFRVFMLNSDLNLPIRNLYDTKNTLGYDRIASVIGGRAIYPNGNILTINVGTCIIYDLLSIDDEYIGGAISLGLRQRLKALNLFTAGLPLVHVDSCDVKLTGTNTQESIASGVVNGMIFEIEGFVKKYKSTYPQLNVIISGGDARYVKGSVADVDRYVDDLVVLGLNKILKYNK